MSNSYRLRTTVGVDKSIRVKLDQDFESLEVLSIKVLQSDVYTRRCSDYGVIIGRVSINNGFGVPNAKVSVFVPLSDSDEVNNPIIGDLYPYKSLTQLNSDGYLYNLLPTEPSYSNHVPTGSFFTRKDVLTNPTKIEIFDKYYKYTAVTNESGDYMILGVPLGSQTVVINVDLSDIGEFSLSPQDLVRMGVATPQQVDGTKFKSSSNLNELPQIITINRNITVEPFWGDENVCEVGITRTDFDLSAEKNITIQPTSIFMGSIISTNDDHSLKRNCKPDLKSGSMCNLIAGPGQIQGIRQTIKTDVNGRPVLEVANLEEGGQVIDDNGTWMFDVPMNLDYVVTNEFGEQVISKDPKKGIPTKGKYRFKIMWNQPTDLGARVKRANFLVPNIKEYGWTSPSGVDPLTGKPTASRGKFGNLDNPCDYDSSVPSTPNGRAAKASYAFSLDWSDYGQVNTLGNLTPLGESMVLEAINCQDRFFEMQYNKVYTVSQLISEYRKGIANNRILSIKNILDDTCESTNNKFPSNDGMYRIDIIFILFQVLMLIAYAILFIVIFLYHLFIWVLCKIIKPIVGVLKDFWCWLKDVGFSNSFFSWHPFRGFAGDRCNKFTKKYKDLEDKCKNTSLKLPNLTYPDCELCSCEPEEPKTTPPDPTDPIQIPNSSNADILIVGSFNGPFDRVDGQGGTFMSPKSNDPLFISGVQPANGGLINLKGVPTDTPSYADGDGYRTFSSDLPWHERFNLFNTKAKYFDDSDDNPGGNVNRIAVRYNTDLNGGPLTSLGLSGLYHFDNVIAVIIDENDESTFNEGDMFTNVDPGKTKDINLTKVSPSNTFGTNSITGSTLGIPYNGDPKVNVRNVVVNYAHPDGVTGNISTTYTITGNSETTFHKFPMDIEYMQVIHKVKLNDYVTAVESLLPDLPNSFYSRVINAGYSMVVTNATTGFEAIGLSNYRYYNSFRGTGLQTNGSNCTTIGEGSCLGYIRQYFPNSENLRILFFVRGVDPNSPKTSISYDLSRLYGKNSWGKKIVTLPNARMNIPIQGKFRCVRHLITDSNLNDTYAGVPLFHDSFMWKPSNYSPQIGPAKDPTTIQFDANGDEIPESGQPYSVTTLDPDYRPEGWCKFNSFITDNHQYYSYIDENWGFPSDNLNLFGLQGYIGIHNPISNGGLRISVDVSKVRSGLSNTYGCYWAPQTGFNSGPSDCWTYYLSGMYWPYANDRTSDNGSCLTQSPIDKKNKGYFPNESVEGGNIALLSNNNLNINIDNALCDNMVPVINFTRTNLTAEKDVLFRSGYYSYTYKSIIPQNLNIVLGSSEHQIVMRSDRLPSSSFEERNNAPYNNMSYTLMGNNNFSYYKISDDGSVQSLEGVGSTSGVGAGADSTATNAEVDCGGDILSTFSCEGLIPLDCYYINNDGNFSFHPKPTGPIPASGPGSCWGNRLPSGSNSEYGTQPEPIFNSACYILGTVPFETLSLDYRLLQEWRARMVVTFAACRNVFSHSFTNNWINGTLYAFSFINSRRFTSPTDPDPKKRNKPYNCLCKNNIYFNNETNNFYYRSSPYNSTDNSFLGRKNPVNWLTGNPFGGNKKNLMFPTTIMDLGPRDVFTQEIVFSNDYDGYVMKNLEATTFKDVSDLLNTFIISRFINRTLLDKILSALGVSAVLKYFSRKNLKIDGDYAQMVSINSELGTLGFSDENYNSCTDIMYNGGDSSDGVFGIYFSSNTQVRDYVTPKRTIITEDSTINNSDCAFEFFKVNTQVVPYYQWFIKPNYNDNKEYDSSKPLYPLETNAWGKPYDTIFGSQLNDWSTEPYSGTTFFSYGYQNLDRLLKTSRYFRTNGGGLLTKYYRGNIYSVDNSTPPVQSSNVTYWDKNSSGLNVPQAERIVNTGAPFYFYFGLYQGKSAFDRFTKKWIDSEILTD